MPDYDVSLYTNKKQKTTPETARRHWKLVAPAERREPGLL